MAQSQTDEKRKRILQRIQEFRLLDDNFMTKCFKNNIECAKLLLHIIMNKLKNGKLSIEEIAECSGLNVDVVNALEENQNAIAY